MLKVLLLRRRIDEKKKELDAFRSQLNDFEKREAELEQAISEATTEEEMKVVDEEIDKFNAEKKDAEDKEKTLAGEVEALENELAEKESEQDTEPVKAVEEERKEEIKMETRKVFGNMTMEERSRLVERDDVKAWLGEIRSAIKQKRAVTGVGATIPTEVLPLLRANIQNYSKLYDKVNVQRVSGEGKQPIQALPSEAIWTECCANLNEMSLVFNDWTVDCYKVGGYYAVCNANLEDSDIDLMNAILIALGQGIGLALDKAILYGRKDAASSNMPQGIVPSLIQTAQPAGYPTTARAWKDLHVKNVITPTEAENKILPLLINSSSIIANDYARGNITWVMNDSTYKAILAQSLNNNAAGALVAGVDGTMPVLGGDIVVLNFVPANTIIFGYFDLYLLAERAGAQFATSEHVRFLNDQTVFKGTARYDGAPIIREAFAVIGATTAPTFPSDTANA